MVPDVAGGGVEIGVERELHGDLAHAFPARGGQIADPGNGVDRLLDRLGDLRLHDLRRGAGIAGDDGDRRGIHRRIFANTHLRERQPPGEGDQQRDHQRQHRSSDAQFSEAHVEGVFSRAAAAAWAGVLPDRSGNSAARKSGQSASSRCIAARALSAAAVSPGMTTPLPQPRSGGW